jgi:hypothetical protein
MSDDLESLGDEETFREGGYAEAVDQLINAGLVFDWPSEDVLDSLGAVTGVSFGPNGDMYILHRGDRMWTARTFNLKDEYMGNRATPILEDTILAFSHNLNHSGLMDTFGSNTFFLPHGITVDHEGNVWITDVALHQVLKFPKGKAEPSLVLGVKFQPGNDDQHFCKPTHVAVASNGDFFVADGYCNARILKFNKDGGLLLMWGKADNGDDVLSADEFKVPHSLALIEELDEICVADREHARIQCFNAGIKDPLRAGNFTGSVDVSQLGAAYAVAHNKEKKALGVLGGIRGEVIRSDLGFYDVKTKQFMHKFSFSAFEGFGDGHALAFNPSGNRALIGSLNKVCPSKGGQFCDNPEISRNVWLFV